MFTGLVQSLGIVSALDNERFALTIVHKNVQLILEDLTIGDSVATDGVCLTVEEILDTGFVATASPETLQRTTLARKTLTSSYVNLETSLRVGSKIGGHFVTGHVDGVGCLIESIATETSWEMTFSYPPSLSEQWYNNIAPYLVSKGSIAVNGISLTVADCDSQGDWFKTAVIPHTYKETNLCYLKTGDLVNLEGDILGKYVERLLTSRLSPSKYPPSPSENIGIDFLTENGYL